jgi:uncharacterized protein YjgD (DUF1641 family)
MSQVIKGMTNAQMANMVRKITNKAQNKFNMHISELSEEEMNIFLEAIAQCNSNKYNNVIRTGRVKDRLREKLERKLVNVN